MSHVLKVNDEKTNVIKAFYCFVVFCYVVIVVSLTQPCPFPSLVQVKFHMPLHLGEYLSVYL